MERSEYGSVQQRFPHELRLLSTAYDATTSDANAPTANDAPTNATATRSTANATACSAIPNDTRRFR